MDHRRAHREACVLFIHSVTQQLDLVLPYLLGCLVLALEYMRIVFDLVLTPWAFVACPLLPP